MVGQEIHAGVNVASSVSTNGHYAHGAQVVNLDETTETRLVKGKALLKTANHTDLRLENPLITHQNVFNPLTALYEKVKD